MQIIKSSELPRDIRTLLLDYGFNTQTVILQPCVEFTCPTTCCDYNIMTLIVYNRATGQHHATRNGHYESVLCWTKEERAMSSGQLKTTLTDDNIWLLLTETYPKHRVTAYCHPSAMALAVDKPHAQLTKRQEVGLFIVRSTKSTFREDEAKEFGLTKREWETLKAELYGLKLLTKAGSLTLEGKNRALSLRFNAWEERGKI